LPLCHFATFEKSGVKKKKSGVKKKKSGVKKSTYGDSYFDTFLCTSFYMIWQVNGVMFLVRLFLKKP
jgi:hypothetical protein